MDEEALAQIQRLALADAFEMEPEFWLSLQRDWDLWHVRKHQKKVKAIRKAA